jgi:hypothetical protein
MTLNFAIGFGVIAVAILHIKTFLYFKIKNPNKTILYGYLTGLIGVYFSLSLLPLSSISKQQPYYKKLNKLTFAFYFFSVIFFLLDIKPRLDGKMV